MKKGKAKRSVADLSFAYLLDVERTRKGKRRESTFLTTLRHASGKKVEKKKGGGSLSYNHDLYNQLKKREGGGKRGMMPR